MKLGFCGSKSRGSTAALLAISVTRGPGRPAGESQNHSRRRTGKDVEEELVGYLWPVRAAASERPCWGRRPEPLSPGDSARDRSAWGWGEGGQAQEAPTPVEGGARFGNLDLQQECQDDPPLLLQKKKKPRSGPRCGYFVWVRSVRHLERNGDLA